MRPLKLASAFLVAWQFHMGSAATEGPTAKTESRKHSLEVTLQKTSWLAPDSCLRGVRFLKNHKMELWFYSTGQNGGARETLQGKYWINGSMIFIEWNDPEDPYVNTLSTQLIDGKLEFTVVRGMVSGDYIFIAVGKEKKRECNQ